MAEKKRTGWDVLVAVLAWCMLAVGPIESMYTYLAGAAGLGVPGWAISGMGGLLHLLRIGVPLLLTPAKNHNLGALLLAALGVLAAALPYIVAALKGLPTPPLPELPDAFGGDLPLAGGFLAVGFPGLRDRLRRLVARGTGALALVCILAVVVLQACARMDEQTARDAKALGGAYIEYVQAATPPATAKDPAKWRADRLYNAEHFLEVTGARWVSWSWKDLAGTVSCAVERWCERNPALCKMTLAQIKEKGLHVRSVAKRPAVCPAAGGGLEVTP